MNREEEIKQEAFNVGGVNPDWGLLESFRIGFMEGARWADRSRAKTKLICLKDKTKVCNQCHDCDVDVLNPSY